MFAENQNGTGEPQLTDAELIQDLNLPEVDPNNATPEQIIALATAAKTALAQKKHWRTKAIDPVTNKPYRDLVAEAQEKTIKTTQSASEAEASNTRIQRLEMAEEKRQFGHQHNLSPEETDHVFAYAQGTGIKPSEALEKPFMKNALESFRNATATQNATPGSSNRSPRVEGKTFQEMDKKEKAKNFQAVVSNLGKKR